MTMWALFVLMSLVAIGFAIWPLGKALPRHTLLVGTCIVLMASFAAGLYSALGSPDVDSGAGQAPDVEQMVTSLAERLQEQPDDVDGWKMLGRSYMTLGNFAGAAEAYDRAIQLESAQNAQTLVLYGVALIEGNGRQITPQAVSVFENALALEPNNLPADVRTMLQQRIAASRGEEIPVEEVPSPALSGVVVANVSVSDEARASLPVDASIFIIARDPAQPSPPIAVTRRSLSELPFAVELGDRESMVPGRKLSAFAEFEMIARVSVSGSPGAQSGDWFASRIVRPAEGSEVNLLIDEQVQ